MSEGRYLNCVVKKLLGSRRKNKCSEIHVLVIRTFCGQTGGGRGGVELLLGDGKGKKRVQKVFGALINSFPYRLGSRVSCSLFKNKSWLLLKRVIFFYLHHSRMFSTRTRYPSICSSFLKCLFDLWLSVSDVPSVAFTYLIRIPNKKNFTIWLFGDIWLLGDKLAYFVWIFTYTITVRTLQCGSYKNKLWLGLLCGHVNAGLLAAGGPDRLLF